MPIIAGAIIGKKIYDSHKKRKKKKKKAAAKRAAREREHWIKTKSNRQTLELKTSEKPNKRRYGTRL